ncbi:MAG: dTMP kinase [Opitutales bacterium]|nr:dTMP kinase [Opitutales bacterium]
MRGKFLSFEGGEGAGKSTQIQLLGENLRSRGFEVVLTREPGGTELGEDLRKIIKYADYGREISQETEALLFAAARAQLVSEVIVPALERGAYVLSDRFVDSSVAYQGAGRVLGMTEIAKLNRFATGGLVPDLTFWIDLPVEVGFARARSRHPELEKKDRMESQELRFYERVREAYVKLAAQNPERIVRIDGEKSIEEIAAQIVFCLNLS